MDTAALLERVRRAAGLTQDELARRAGTSGTAVSAYEHGRKSPTLATATRLLAESGVQFDVVPRIGALSPIKRPRERVVTGLILPGSERGRRWPGARRPACRGWIRAGGGRGPTARRVG